MARIRTIKPEFWTDSLMVQLPPLARLLYIGLWNFADDHGRLPDEPDRICMEVMPREDEALIESYIDLLVAIGRVSRMVETDGGSFLQIDRWSDHQRVDHPSRSKFSREGSRKLSISTETRRVVAKKYGCEPGGEVDVTCFVCGAPGGIYWHKLRSGKPSSWVSFTGVEIDHYVPEAHGGASNGEDIVLTCRRCNRSRGAKEMIEFVCETGLLENPREDSRTFSVGKERKGKEGKGREEKESQPQQSEPRATLPEEPLQAAAAAPAGGGSSSKRFDPLSADSLEHRLRSAAGYENEPGSALFIVGDIQRLIDEEGFDLDRDILPVVRAKAHSMHAAGAKPARSWRFFLEPIREAKAKAAPSAAGAPPRPPGDPTARLASVRARMYERGFDVGTELGCRKALLLAVRGDWFRHAAVADPLSSAYDRCPVIPTEWIRSHLAVFENLVGIHTETAWQHPILFRQMLTKFGIEHPDQTALNDASNAFRAAGGVYLDISPTTPRYETGEAA